jgi:hypothetical protein
VGFVTDHVFRDEQRIGASMSLVSAVANPIAAWVLWLAFKAARARP